VLTEGRLAGNCYERGTVFKSKPSKACGPTMVAENITTIKEIAILRQRLKKKRRIDLTLKKAGALGPAMVCGEEVMRKLSKVPDLRIGRQILSR